jgi:DNA-binding MarR family transcriptional regulator
MSLPLMEKLHRYESLITLARQDPELDPGSCGLFLSLLRTGDAVTELEESYLGRHNITPGRFAVMLLLGAKGATTLKPSELAELTGVTRATMTGLIDTLERDGMVRRSVVPQDRRVTSIEATPACRALLKKLLPGYFRLVAAISATLTEAEREQYVALSRKIREGLAPAAAKFVPRKPGGAVASAKRNGRAHD